MADGFLNLLKPPGMTSHDAVAWLRGLTRTAAGHTGTLDRAAAGVLVLCIGRARRFGQWAMEGEKAYVGEVTFGVTSDTLDADGQVLTDVDASAVTAERVAAALTHFEGEIEQDAPAFSAVHADGQRMHELARQGRTPPRRTRTVSITSARLLDFESVTADPCAARHPRARIAVECSKGTYIRTLAADLGATLGCGAVLSFLVRTRSGAFDIADAVTIEETQRAVGEGRFQRILQPLDVPLKGLPAAVLDERAAHLVRHGGAVPAPEGMSDTHELVRVYGPAGTFVGLARWHDGHLHPQVMVAE